MSLPADSHRLSILSAEEIEDLFRLPRFTDHDRQVYFDLSAPECATVAAGSTSVGAYLALELGYFKAKRQFFGFEPESVLDDLASVLQEVPEAPLG